MRPIPTSLSIMRRIAIGVIILLMVLVLAACNRENRQEPELETEPAAAAAEPAASTEAGAEAEAPAAEASGEQVTPVPAEVTLPTATPAPTVAPLAGTLTLWHSWAQRDGDALEAILRSFGEVYPDVRVETLFVAQDDLLQSYAQAVADGSGPDIVLAPNWWLYDLFSVGALAALDAPAYDHILASVWPSAADNLRVDGQLYGVPVSYETVALYTNRDLLPNGAVAASLEQLAAVAGQDSRYGIGIYANPFHVQWGFPAFGASLFDGSGKAVLDETEGAAAFLQWLASVDATEGSFVSDDYGMLLDRFKRGEYAYFIDGPWSLPELSDVVGDSLGVAAIPPGPVGESRPWLYADAAYVRPNLSAQQEELAAAFLAHLVGQESAATLASVAGRLPANRSVDLGQYPRLNGFAQQAQNAIGMEHGPEMDAYWRYGGDMVLRAVAGVEDLDLIVAETTALTNEATGH